MTQVARFSATKRTKGVPTRSLSGGKTPARDRPIPNPTARRKRQLTQRVRRVEATFTQVSLNVKAWRFPWSLPALSQVGFSGWRASKIISLLLFLGAVGTVGWVHTDDRWFVYQDSVHFRGVHYLNPKQLYQASGIDSWNIFWLQPETIRQQLLRLPYVTNVKVQMSLPNQVEISIQEAQPAALWVTNNGTLWLMADGTALAAQGQTPPDVTQIIDGGQEAKALDMSKGLAMDQNILKCALLLKQRMPAIEQIRYNKDYGLNFHLPGSDTWVYWGDGYRTETKLANLGAIQSLIQAGKGEAQIIDVRFDRPYMH